MVKEIFLESLKAKDKFVRFKAMVPAGEAKPVAPLGPLLGQYGVNLVEFCSDFNKRTDHYLPGVMIPVIISKMVKERAYKMELKAPNLPFLIYCVVNCGGDQEAFDPEFSQDGILNLSECDEIDKVVLYDLIRLSDIISGRDNLERSASVVLGCLSSTGIKFIS